MVVSVLVKARVCGGVGAVNRDFLWRCGSVVEIGGCCEEAREILHL